METKIAEVAGRTKTTMAEITIILATSLNISHIQLFDAIIDKKIHEKLGEKEEDEQ